MRPSLVLDDEEKKKRFKKFREGTIDSGLTTDAVEDSASEEDDEILVISDSRNQQASGSLKKKTHRSEDSKTYPFILKPWHSQESSDSEEDKIFPLPIEEVRCSDDSDDYTNDIGLLDPQTGISELDQQSDGLWNNISYENLPKMPPLIPIFDVPLTSSRNTHGTTPSSSLEKYGSYNAKEEEQIIKYIHKKFRKPKIETRTLQNKTTSSNREVPPVLRPPIQKSKLRSIRYLNAYF